MSHADASSDLAFASLHDLERDPHGFASALGRSFEATGFAVVRDHGIDPDLIARVHAAARRFFEQDQAIKQAACQPQLAGARGYTPPKIETAKGAFDPDLKEFWHIGRTLPPGHPFRSVMPDNVEPPGAPDLAAAGDALFLAFERVGLALLRAVALHLDLEPDFFAGPTRDGDSVLRLLRYPPVTPGEAGMRAAPHEDINVITLLLGADEAGLEARTPQGRWIAVSPRPGELVVNVADMLQRLTNHRLPSTTHRVVNPTPERAGRARYSMPFFLHFAPDYLIETLPSCVSASTPNRYPTPITAHAYLRERLAQIGLER